MGPVREENLQNLPGGPVVGKTGGVRASTLNSHARRGRCLSAQATGPATLTALRGRQHGHPSPAVAFMTPGIPGRSGRGLGGIPPPKLFCRAGIHERPPVTAGGDTRVSPARQRGPLPGAGVSAGARVARWAEGPTLGFGSAHDPRAVGSSTTSGSTLSVEPAWDSLSASPSAPRPALSRTNE